MTANFYDSVVDLDLNFSSSRSKRAVDEDYQIYNVAGLYGELNQTLPIPARQLSPVQFKWEKGNFGPVNL